jgi:hypothetical protein
MVCQACGHGGGLNVKVFQPQAFNELSRKIDCGSLKVPVSSRTASEDLLTFPQVRWGTFIYSIACTSSANMPPKEACCTCTIRYWRGRTPRLHLLTCRFSALILNLPGRSCICLSSTHTIRTFCRPSEPKIDGLLMKRHSRLSHVLASIIHLISRWPLGKSERSQARWRSLLGTGDPEFEFYGRFTLKANPSPGIRSVVLIAQTEGRVHFACVQDSPLSARTSLGRKVSERGYTQAPVGPSSMAPFQMRVPGGIQ